MYKRLFFSALLALPIIIVSHFCTAAVFECALWPEEYRPRPLAKTELSIYKKPSFGSDVIEGEKIHKGQEIDFDKTIYRTVKPGQAKVNTSLTIDGTSYGNIEYLSKDDYYYKGYSKTINVINLTDRLVLWKILPRPYFMVSRIFSARPNGFHGYLKNSLQIFNEAFDLSSGLIKQKGYYAFAL